MRLLLLALMLVVGLVGCAGAPILPDQAPCLSRMQRHVAHLQPGFAALGFRTEVNLQLDEDLTDSRGFRKPGNVLGDATPSGRVRLRPSRVCPDETLARAVVAHELAHVALGHLGVLQTGLVLQWDRPPAQETEADELAFKVLTHRSVDSSESRRSAALVNCWLGNCGGFAPRPGGKPKAMNLEVGR